MELTVLRQPLDSQHFPTVNLRCEDQTGVHRRAVEEDRTGAALADFTPAVGARQTEIVAQHLQQGVMGGKKELLQAPVDGAADETPPSRRLRE